MNFLQLLEEEVMHVNSIGNLFPVGKVTLVHGKQGSGKSYSVIEALNRCGVKPIYGAIEHTDGLIELSKFYLNGEALVSHMVNDTLDSININGSVVILDTYTRLQGMLPKMYDDAGILALLETWTERYNITLIVIGHTEQHVSDVGIFSDNTVLVRGCAEELYLSKDVKKGTIKHPDAVITYNLHVRKGRGLGGAKVLPNWCRDEMQTRTVPMIHEYAYVHMLDSAIGKFTRKHVLHNVFINHRDFYEVFSQMSNENILNSVVPNTEEKGN